MRAIHVQELNSKETQRRREKDIRRKRTIDTRCRVCDQKGESVHHLVCSCPALAPALYLKVRHNQITKILYQEVIKNDHLILSPPEVTIEEPFEIWYDMEIQTTPKVEKSKLDIVVWNKAKNKYSIVEITVSLDTNLHKAYKEKETKHINLLSKMQQLYKEYKFNPI